MKIHSLKIWTEVVMERCRKKSTLLKKKKVFLLFRDSLLRVHFLLTFLLINFFLPVLTFLLKHCSIIIQSEGEGKKIHLKLFTLVSNPCQLGYIFSASKCGE